MSLNFGWIAILVSDFATSKYRHDQFSCILRLITVLKLKIVERRKKMAYKNISHKNLVPLMNASNLKSVRTV